MMHSVLANASGMKEFFECEVEEICDDHLRLRTKRLSGKKGRAFLEISKIKESDRKYIKLMAKIHVTVYSNFTHVHLLRTV